MTEGWFSAMVRLITTVKDVGPTTFVRSVFVFRAADWEAARLRAIELGRGAEATYRNADGQLVSQRLLLVETLDHLGERIEDGREVYSEPVDAGREPEPIALDFNPANSRPTQSGV